MEKFVSKPFTHCAIFTIAFLLAIPTAKAQVYKWVDANGQTHFTQKPPPENQAQAEAAVVKVQEQSSKVYTKNGKSFCGDIELPSHEDPLYLLAEIRSRKESWEQQIVRKQQNLKRQLEVGRRSGGHLRSGASRHREKMDNILASIDDLKCTSRWARDKEIELEPNYQQFKKDYQAAQDSFDQYKNRCGPKPDIVGYTTDPRAKEWVRCERAGGTSEHNRRLREVKKMKSLAYALEE